jgi:competence protein ComFB
METKNSNKIIVANVMEEMVHLHMDDCVSTTEMCKCERCVLDVYALALNMLNHHYVAAFQCDLIFKARAMTIMGKGEIIAAITQAIVIVKGKPRHKGYEDSIADAFKFKQTEKPLIVKNTMEELVDININRCMKDSDMCTCERCRADVFAIALNNLPACYVATTVGDLFVRVNSMSEQGQTDIIAAIMGGILTVKAKPRHGDETNTDSPL